MDNPRPMAISKPLEPHERLNLHLASGAVVSAAAGDWVFAIFNAMPSDQQQRVLNALSGMGKRPDPQAVQNRHTVREDAMGLVDVVEPRREFNAG